MPRRIRTFLGTVAILLFVMAYALLAMALAESRIQAAPAVVQAIAYFLLGIAWVVPVFPLIRWMEGPKKAPMLADNKASASVPQEKGHAR